ncbi:MAG: tyrosinase family protein [Actinomycetota bacterium]
MGAYTSPPPQNERTLLTRYDIWDLNEGNVAEFPLENPPGWDAVSLFYAKALQQMGWKNPRVFPPSEGDPGFAPCHITQTWDYSESPTSYYFQAAMHWTPQWPDRGPDQLPGPYGDWWNHCTHGPASAENYFLAWHRSYIYWFEVIIRSYVQQLGGPDGWALPYWNYSYHDESNPEVPWPRAKLPWVFTQPQLPDGSGNPLYIPDTVRRGLQPTWPGETPPETMYLSEMTPYYYQAYDLSDYFEFNSRLDREPHGAVHVDVGSGDGQVSASGWMASTITASFDPIFWLHHSEVDRFWQGWLADGNHNPSDPDWLSAQNDPMRTWRWNYWGDDDITHKIVVYPGQMLDPSNLSDPFLHSYRYANLPQLPAPRPSGPAQRLAVAASRAATPAAPGPELAALQPELAGVNAVLGMAQNVELGKEPASTSLALAPEARSLAQALLAAAPEAPARVELVLEGVAASGPPGNYEIYLNYPDADRRTAGTVPNFVGLLAGFGADHQHEGHAHGLTMSYDITDLVRYLETTGGWDPAQATVTFVPAARPRPGRELVIGRIQVANITIRTL